MYVAIVQVQETLPGSSSFLPHLPIPFLLRRLSWIVRLRVPASGML